MNGYVRFTFFGQGSGMGRTHLSHILLPTATLLILSGCGSDKGAKAAQTARAEVASVAKGPHTGDVVVEGATRTNDAYLSNPSDPPFKIMRPRWLPLVGSEITRIIPGQRLSLDRDYEVAPGLKPELGYVGGCYPLEIFYVNGRWESHFCFRGPQTYRGHWTVERFRGGEHLCVEGADFEKTCRFVWQGRDPDRLFMPAWVSSRSVQSNNALDTIFNPYVLTPIDGHMGVSHSRLHLGRRR